MSAAVRTRTHGAFSGLAGGAEGCSNVALRLLLGYVFDACRTGRVTAFASDLHIFRSGVAARFTAVFLATFHHTGARNVGTGFFLSC
jgi:hypothetical protein